MHLRDRRWARWVSATVSVWFFAAAARGDLLALGRGGLPRVLRFDAAGRYAGAWPTGAESTDALGATPDGWVYFADNALGGGQLGRFRADDPSALQFFPEAGGLLDFKYQVPGRLSVGSDGRVYLTSNRFGGAGVSGVLRFDPADRSLRQVVSVPDAAPGGAGHSADVALAPNGDIYLDRAGVGVERYNGASGAWVGLVIPQADLGSAGSSFEFGPDGRIYVPNERGVDRFDSETGALVDHFIPNGTSGLSDARDLSFGPDGLLYVNSFGNGSILRFDAATGAFRDTFVTPEQYRQIAPDGLSLLAAVVPEPTAGIFAIVFAGVTLARRRRGPKLR